MVTNTTVPTELMETGEQRDRIGRKITPAARRAELVAAWRESVLTQAAFARREGVTYSSFAAWVQAARRSAAGAPKPKTTALQFAEVRLPRPLPAAARPLEVRLPDGTMLRGSNAAEQATLVRALRA